MSGNNNLSQRVIGLDRFIRVNSDVVEQLIHRRKLFGVYSILRLFDAIHASSTCGFCDSRQSQETRSVPSDIEFARSLVPDGSSNSSETS